MRLTYIPRQDARGFLRAAREMWSQRLGRKVTLVEMLHWAVERLMEEYQWRPNMGKRVRSLSTLAKQYGLDPTNNKLEYSPINCGNCGGLIPLWKTASDPGLPTSSSGDPMCQKCGHTCHPEILQ